MVPGPGSGPESQMGPGMEPGFPPGVRHWARDRPFVLLRAVDQREMYVPVCGRVVRDHGDGAPVHDGRFARVEHVAAAEDGQEVLLHCDGWWR